MARKSESLERLAPLYAAMAYKLICGRTAAEQPEPLKVQGDSEFLRTASGKDHVIYIVTSA